LRSSRCRRQRGAFNLEFRVLGPLEIVKDGRSLSVRGKLLRALVLALLLKARTVCTADELIDALWAASAPRSARASLHNMLSILRRGFGPGILLTTPSGYLLAADDDTVDAARFERLVERAHAADASAKLRLLDQALALWRGSPLVDVRYEEFAQVRFGASRSFTSSRSRSISPRRSSLEIPTLSFRSCSVWSMRFRSASGCGCS
jgi:SARP family transcriptional regulator, regulator of embCAB operon